LIKRFFQLLLSLAAAAFGVQSQRNLKRDFASDSPWKFIIGGIGFTLFLVVAILFTVNLALGGA
jgi:hypothetical protein